MVDFIRYFAATDASPIGQAALGYLKSLCRIAPVRVISKTGGLDGPWLPYEALLMTPMAGTYVNCVCTHPSAWVWTASVPMPADNLGAMGAAQATSAPKAKDVARGQVELYTAKVRNVLFVVEQPRTEPQLKAMCRYEAVLFADHDAVSADLVCAAQPAGHLREGAYVDFVWETLDHRKICHSVIRAAVMGKPVDKQGEQHGSSR